MHDIGGKVGVDIFVMIGAYFLVGKSFKFKRIVKLILMIIFIHGLYIYYP